MVRKFLTCVAVFLGCLFIVNDVQAKPMKIVILNGGNNLSRDSLRALEPQFLQMDRSIRFHQLDILQGTEEQVKESFANCNAVLYCRCPDEPVAQIFLQIVCKGKSCHEEQGVIKNAFPKINNRITPTEVRRFLLSGEDNPKINREMRHLAKTARRLREILNTIPNNHMAFVNLWVSNERNNTYDLAYRIHLDDRAQPAAAPQVTHNARSTKIQRPHHEVIVPGRLPHANDEMIELSHLVPAA